MNRTLNKTEESFYSKLRPHIGYITLWLCIIMAMVFMGMATVAENAVWGI